MSMRGGRSRSTLRLMDGGLAGTSAAVERRTHETECDRATREFARGLSAPVGRHINRNYQNIARSWTKPAAPIERRLVEARDAGVPVELAKDLGMQWIADLITAVWAAPVLSQRGPTPTAPAARSKAA